MQDTHKTPVNFVISEGEVTAVFFCDSYNWRGDLYHCYAHLGQHGSCSDDWWREQTEAIPEQYAELKAELIRIGYNLEIK